MFISIQTSTKDKAWDSTPYSLHKVNTISDAVMIAQAIATHTDSTVRLTYIPANMYPGVSLDYICRLSGNYFQSKADVEIADL